MADDKKQIEEIRKMVNTCPSDNDYSAYTINFLLAQIDKRDEALRDAKNVLEDMDNWDGTQGMHPTESPVLAKIRKALGE